MRKRPPISCNLVEVELFQVFEMISNISQKAKNPEIEDALDRKHVRVTKRDYGCPSSLSERTGFRCVADDRRFSLPIFLRPLTTLRKPKSVPAYRWPEEFQDPAVFKE